MSRAASIAGCLTVILAFAVSGAAPQKPFIECTPEELVRQVPELAHLQFDSDQANLHGLLRATGENVETMFAKLVNLSAAEDIHEMRFEESLAGNSRREVFRYTVKLLPPDVPERFIESRIDPRTGAAVKQPARIDFLVTGHFLKLLDYLLPQYREQSLFRYLGSSTSGGQTLLVVAFAQRPEGIALRGNIQLPDGRTAPLQGLAWIDADTRRLVRLRLDLLRRIEGFSLESVTTDIDLVPVDFKAIGRIFDLPATVTVHGRYAGGEVRSVHRYSDYQVESDGSAGIPAVAAPSGEDAYELAVRGLTLIRDGKPGEAIAPLREALRLNPDLAVVHFNLGNALRETGDGAGAETESREAVKLVPESGVAHNLLGIVLAKRGDVPGTVTEFRKTVQLQPKQPISHFNLAQALEKSGDRAAALEEYRAASELAPENAVLKTRYQEFERASKEPAAPPNETTIKVDVRQVLVPVIVTDHEGHHVTGLTRADFQVFEDGVEQKISAFSVEDVALSGAPGAEAIHQAPEQSARVVPVAPANPKPTRPRRTYVICIDALHGAFASLAHVRQALLKLFQSEQTGDSQYVLLAIGSSMQVLQNTTSDPLKVLQAIESKSFLKMYLASRKSSTDDEMREYRGRLDEARAACDAGQPECPALKEAANAQAGQIASEERMVNVAFLSQFHSLVQQLAHATDRRTIVLISDGFLLVPGKEASELLLAYFPDLRFNSLRTVDRMQELDPILRLAANSNIPIYTIDSRGLYTPPFFEASNPGGSVKVMPAVMRIMDSDAEEAGGTLSEMAGATGGTAFQNSNDLLNGLQRAFADGRQYYMLAYVPGNSTPDGKFRAISVRLRDRKLVVKAKRGYWAVAN